ncbi:MAG: NAD-dependent epimerase/dehydratase family protein [Planctomycetota bacterium]|jgi:nucleoside-diphosphate-sugar epimerase|nr:NAD-dependent epimerase/dehydratase family protein [Planctomycetota bacterium]
MAKRAFIIGGAGQIGLAVAERLLTDGWEVVAARRGTRLPAADLPENGMRTVTLDRDDTKALRRALADGADAVVDVVAYNAGHADQLLLLGADIASLVVISSAGVYRDAAGRTLDEAGTNGFPDFPIPISETQPTVEPGSASYSANKAAMERRLFAYARVPVTIIRPGAVYGVPSRHPREWWFVKRMLDRRPFIPLAYKGESRFHPVAAANIAAIVAGALKNPGTRVVNAADPVVPTVREIGEIIASALGYPGRFVPVDSNARPSGVGATPWSIPKPMVLDFSGAERLGGGLAATYKGTAGIICRWLVETASAGDWRERFPVLASYPRDHFDYAAEDDLGGLDQF